MCHILVAFMALLLSELCHLRRYCHCANINFFFTVRTNLLQRHYECWRNPMVTVAYKKAQFYGWHGHFHYGRVSVSVGPGCVLEVFIDAWCLVHYKLIDEGRTVNKEMSVEPHRPLSVAVKRKRPVKGARNSWFLLHVCTSARLPIGA
jgi:hypothetical protein